MRQFKIVTDFDEEILAYEKPALKAYYKAKKELITSINDEESEIEDGFVTLLYRDIDEKTGKPGEWNVYQEYKVLSDDEDDDSLDSIDDDSVNGTDDDED